MSNLKKSLIALSTAVAVTGMVAATAPAMAGTHANPCAAKAKMNPCKANPCAAKAKMNPCKANPCAAKAKMNPCKAK